MQREELDADRERLHSEFEGLVGKQQERAAEWEAAAQEEEAGIAHRKHVSMLLLLPPLPMLLLLLMLPFIGGCHAGNVGCAGMS